MPEFDLPSNAVSYIEAAQWETQIYIAPQDLWLVGDAYTNPANLHSSGAPIGGYNLPHQQLANRTAWLKDRVGKAAPAGQVAYFAASAAPAGWLKCNGATVSRSTYAALFAVIGTDYNTGGEAGTEFRLPDLRGEFLRGWDDGRGIDTGRALGSAQAGAVQGHSHYLPTGTSVLTGARWCLDDPAGGTGFPDTSSPDYYGGPWVWTQPNNVPALFGDGSGIPAYTLDDVVTHPSMDSETRPRNIALLPCIKY